jgi:hypothetical protein
MDSTTPSPQSERPELAGLTFAQMRARAISRLDQAAAIHLQVQKEIRYWNEHRAATYGVMPSPPWPDWMAGLMDDLEATK